jgi:hypothetical protein
MRRPTRRFWDQAVGAYTDPTSTQLLPSWDDALD